MLYKNLFALIVAAFFASSIFAQEYVLEEGVFMLKRNKSYQIAQDEQDLSKIYIKVSKWNGKEFIEKDSIDLDVSEYEADFTSFGESIYMDRRFVIIQARYSFFILNLYNDKLIGPLKPKFYGIGEDSQSGMLVNLKIIMDGRFIIGYCVDSGGFLFDLTDLYHPKEAKSANNPYANQNKIYALKNLETTDKYFGLFVSTGSWEVDSKCIFSKRKIESYEHQIQEKQLTEIEIEALLMEPENMDSQFTILKEIIAGDSFKYLIYSNQTGKQVALPSSVNDSDIEEIKKFLSNYQNN